MTSHIHALRLRAAEGDPEALAVICDYQAELGIHPHETEIMSVAMCIGSLGGDAIAPMSDGFGNGYGYGDDDGDGGGTGYVDIGDKGYGFGGDGDGNGCGDGGGYGQH